jgi:hypothetical protein
MGWSLGLLGVAPSCISVMGNSFLKMQNAKSKMQNCRARLGEMMVLGRGKKMMSCSGNQQMLWTKHVLILHFAFRILHSD